MYCLLLPMSAKGGWVHRRKMLPAKPVPLQLKRYRRNRMWNSHWTLLHHTMMTQVVHSILNLINVHRIFIRPVEEFLQKLRAKHSSSKHSTVIIIIIIHRVPTKLWKQNSMTFPRLICFFPWLPFSHGFRYGYNCLTTCTTVGKSKAAIAMRTSNSMTFPWHLATLHDFLRNFDIPRLFHDFPW